MEIIKLVVGYLETNCYILSSNKREAIIIDPGADYKGIQKFLKSKGLIAAAVLLTHSHFDHIGGVSGFQRDGINIFVSERLDDELLENSVSRAGYFVEGYKIEKFDLANATKIDCGKELCIAGISIKAIETAGHSKDGLCFLIEDNLISGDTLFLGTYGKTETFTGSFNEIKKSIKEKLFTLPDKTKVFPGHGEDTTIGREKLNNCINF